MTFIDIVRPLWRLLDPLRREQSRVLDSLVTYNEMLPLEPDDCLSTLSQKPPTSTQPTSPTAPTSAPALSYPSIAPIPTFDCAFQTPLHSSQTAVSNLHATRQLITTASKRCRRSATKTAQRQIWRSKSSTIIVKVSCTFTGGCVSHCSLLPAILKNTPSLLNLTMSSFFFLPFLGF